MGFCTFLGWAVRTEACIPLVLHHLDDFLFLGPPGFRVSGIFLHTMERVALAFRVPLVPDKTEGLLMLVKFLGILIDMECIKC